MLQLNSKEVICHLYKGDLPYSGKSLKYMYRDYRDKLYMIIGTENFDDTHPYN